MKTFEKLRQEATEDNPLRLNYTGFELVMMGWELGASYDKYESPYCLDDYFELVVYPDRMECLILCSDNEWVPTTSGFCGDIDGAKADLERLANPSPKDKEQMIGELSYWEDVDAINYVFDYYKHGGLHLSEHLNLLKFNN